jgi:hypothetical protein
MKGATLMRLDAETTIIKGRNVEYALDLSESRAYDCALEILEAHKLTGNFHVNLEIVVKHLGAYDKVTFEIEPKSYLVHNPSRRHVDVAVIFRAIDHNPIFARHRHFSLPQSSSASRFTAGAAVFILS